MTKDLILITTFVPDIRRQQMLRDLVYNIDKTKFDIMVSSHSSIPQDVFDKVDYMIYEKQNAIDFKVENKFYFFFYNDLFTIKTTEPKKYNHFIPVIRHIISGLSYAKNLGYKNVHYFEYDSLILDSTELLENSNLLKTYSAIYYELPHMQFPNSPISLNLDKISQLWFDLDNENFNKFLKEENSTKLVEEYEWFLLNQSGNIMKKNIDNLIKKNIKVALNYDLESNKWVIPIHNKETDDICIFSWVENHEDVNSDVVVIINENRIINLNRKNLGTWELIPISKTNDVKKIKIIINDVVKYNYDFNKTSIDKFVKHNFLSKNK